MTKSELRTLYKSKRKELSSEEVNVISLRILENLQSMQIWGNSSFHVFIPISNQKEINTLPIIDYLFHLEKQVSVPKVEEDRMLSCLINENTEFESGKFNVPEPKSFQLIDSKQIDVIFMPMLICDQNGNRIGYGGGYYDQFLKDCRKDIIKIGLNFFAPIPKIENIFESDVPLDYCVTGEEIVSF
ncbi:5-formyltetrahydrofolate cyclo-ligase [Moheibacter sediminis]|uniref:5-formyltetrahydrofolate cyclo-ligase n=1 Tax=Moheibacter sediminis TaxID=1434700 RepID=A0A1W2BCE0_9FLAO|nr:5-formyltetrahydrofolate cyclo-ligase [Moheibacter sediminis]SMC70504.1 5-formyltetrahydrofolate cyclo-ligase [Moheibacter sediminis]